MNSRCCARCRTPYNCGNPACTCHPEAAARAADAARINRESQANRALLDIDRRRSNRNPDLVPGAEK